MKIDKSTWAQARIICGCAVDDAPENLGLLERLRWVRKNNMGRGTDGEINLSELDELILAIEAWNN